MATKRPRRTFQQILDNVAAIRRFTAGLDERAFKGNDLVIAAVERCLSRISEAAVRLEDSAEAVAPNLPGTRYAGSATTSATPTTSSTWT